MKDNIVNRRAFSRRLVFSFLFPLFSFLFFIACSSAPARTGEVVVDRDTSLRQLNLATQAANRGRYEDALLFLDEARRLAVSADDPVMRMRTSISRGNFLFALGHEDAAFEEWEAAAAEGDAAGLALLASLARIYSIRASLMLLDRDENTAAALSSAQDYITRINREMAIVRTDQMAAAAAFITLGLAEKQLGRWAEAEGALRRALEIYERNFYLEDAAYTWFLIGAVRSVSGRHDAALEALRIAIGFDRRAENGYGLASSWQAMGGVYLNAGRHNESQAAFRRAEEIFRAIGLNQHAERISNRL